MCTFNFQEQGFFKDKSRHFLFLKTLITSKKPDEFILSILTYNLSLILVLLFHNQFIIATQGSYFLTILREKNGSQMIKE